MTSVFPRRTEDNMRRYAWIIVLGVVSGGILVAQEAFDAPNAPVQPSNHDPEQMVVKVYHVGDLVAIPQAGAVGLQQGTLREWSTSVEAGIEVRLDRLANIARLA